MPSGVSCPSGYEHSNRSSSNSPPFHVEPSSSETYAVLSVSVSGHGTGRLAVGDRVVPLFLPEPTRSDPPASCAYACLVPRGQDVPVFLCADGTLWSGSAQGMSRLADSVRLPASTGIVIPPPDTPFVDVPSSAYYHDAVVWAVKQNVTNGVDDTHFGPDSSCTRAQMVTFLWRAEGSPEPTGAQNDYSDVAVGTYYEKAVRWAAEQGITNGTAPNRFSPDAPVTRAQTVTFLWRMESGQNAAGAIPFVDVPAGAYYTEAVAWAVEHGVTNGTDQTHFSPDANCTRAQIVTFLYRDLKS